VARIELCSLAKVFGGGFRALDPLDLTIPVGELLVVLGPSGSGKTTLLRLIAGLEVPSAGRVLIDGLDVTGLPPHRRDVAMVFQHPALYPHLSVFDNIAFGLRARGVPRGQIVSRVNAMAGLLDLEGLLNRRPAQLSGGERQRVAIGRGLIRQPRVILLDEPFSNLDARLRTGLREQVVEIHRQFGTTLIHVTHDQSEALLMGQQLAVFDQGRLQQVGTPRAIYECPKNRFVATFVGSPPMNILPCKIELDADHASVYPIAVEGAIKWRAARASLPADRGAMPCRLDLGFRPEAVALREAEERSGESAPSYLGLPAQIGNVQYNGSETLATVTSGRHRLVARLSPARHLTVGERVIAVVDTGLIWWFDPEKGTALEPLSGGTRR
jgi:ABC-type sugar transport system ATPase subunit